LNEHRDVYMEIGMRRTSRSRSMSQDESLLLQMIG
jgi:hypothetical protein